MVKSTCRKWA